MSKLMELVDIVTGRSVREAIEKGWFTCTKEVKAYKEIQAISDQMEFNKKRLEAFELLTNRDIQWQVDEYLAAECEDK